MQNGTNLPEMHFITANLAVGLSRLWYKRQLTDTSGIHTRQLPDAYNEDYNLL